LPKTIPSSWTIKPSINDELKAANATFDLSSIDLNPNTKSVQETAFTDLNGKGKFTLNMTTGVVTFTPSAGKTGDAIARYTIRDSNKNTSTQASITVTISTTVNTGPIKILFIGNSRTWYQPCSGTSGQFPAYNIPTMLQAMSVNETRAVQATVVTDCGRTLSEHWNTFRDVQAPIATKGWDYVVLQMGTAETDTGSQQSTLSLLKFQYKDAILNANPNAKIVLYENWSLKNAPNDQPRLTDFYQLVANDLGTKIAPVGRAWRQTGFLETQLFIDDNESKHATTLGAYTAASTFFSLIYGKQAPSTIGVPSVSSNFPQYQFSSVDASAARTKAFGAYSGMDAKYK
jgi:Surface adhesin CshA repetitive domain